LIQTRQTRVIARVEIANQGFYMRTQLCRQISSNQLSFFGIDVEKKLVVKPNEQSRNRGYQGSNDG
jgi:hypothetical protein